MIDMDERIALCDMDGLTLNGRPARVSGATLPFARVTDNETGLSAEWAWATVKHVIDNKGGAFQS